MQHETSGGAKGRVYPISDGIYTIPRRPMASESRRKKVNGGLVNCTDSSQHPSQDKPQPAKDLSRPHLNHYQGTQKSSLNTSLPTITHQSNSINEPFDGTTAEPQFHPTNPFRHYAQSPCNEAKTEPKFPPNKLSRCYAQSPYNQVPFHPATAASVAISPSFGNLPSPNGKGSLLNSGQPAHLLGRGRPPPPRPPSPPPSIPCSVDFGRRLDNPSLPGWRSGSVESVIPEVETSTSAFPETWLATQSAASPPALLTSALSTCKACLEELPISKFPTTKISATCSHPLIDICEDCVQESLRVQVSSQSTSTIGCPLCHSPVTHTDMKYHAAPEIFEIYDLRTAQNTMENVPGFVWCPIGDCGAGQIHEGGDREPMVTCVRCRKPYCFVHHLEWHQGLTCQEFDHPGLVQKNRAAEEAQLRRQEDERIRSENDRRAVEEVRQQRRKRAAERDARLREEQQGYMAAMRISKRCIGPGCNWRAEKDEHCKHVTC